MKQIISLLLAVLLCLGMAGCMAEPSSEGNMNYKQISQETAREMMAKHDGHVLVDVRRQDEYDAGHIPGAILIPNESIVTEPPAALPDLEQIILIYCRSGNRSKQAAQKLADMGYANIYEFGGIIDWTGATITSEQEAMVTTTPMLVIEANGRVFHATLENNSSAHAFMERLNSESVAVDMHDYGNFEKVGPLPWSLPTNDEQITTVPGDVILYQGNQITIYYDQNTWTFTRLAKIDGVTQEELLEAFENGNVTISFSLEWSE